MNFVAKVVTLTIAIVACVLAGMFAFKRIALKASKVESAPHNVFVSFLDGFEDLQVTAYKDNFGWGGLETLSTSVRSLAPHLSNCRQYKKEGSDNFRFEVKVEVAQQRFRVVGILSGSEKNPEMAQCLRDKINEAKVEQIATLKNAPEDSYRLKIEVQNNVATETY